MTFTSRLSGMLRAISLLVSIHWDDDSGFDSERFGKDSSDSNLSNSDLGNGQPLPDEHAGLCPDLQRLVERGPRLFPEVFMNPEWPPHCWIIFHTRGRDECHFRCRPTGYEWTMGQANDRALQWIHEADWMPDNYSAGTRNDGPDGRLEWRRYQANGYWTGFCVQKKIRDKIDWKFSLRHNTWYSRE